MPSLDHDLEVLEAIQDCRSYPELRTLANVIVEKYDFSIAAYYSLRGLTVGKTGRLLGIGVDRISYDYYVESGFGAIDQALKRAETTSLPFLDARPRKRCSNLQGRLTEFKDHYSMSGLVVPVRASASDLAVFYFGAKFREAGWRDMGSELSRIYLLCNGLHARFMELSSSDAAVSPDVKLTAREKEILCWAGDGLVVKAIAQKVGLSESAIKFHMMNIRKKLGSGTTAHALLKAIRTGLIHR